MELKEMKELYLGDGAYARMSPFGEVVIYTSNGLEATNTVVLGLHEVDALLIFIEHNKGEIQ